MDRLVEQARSLIPNKWTVAKVRAKGDDPSLYLVQVAGRAHDIVARSNMLHIPGDDVLVLLEPNVNRPIIVGLSPWNTTKQVVASTRPDGQPWTVADIQSGQLEAAIESNVDVVANLAKSHDKLHGFTSVSDHSDVEGTPSDQEVLAFVSSKWRPSTVVMVLDGGTR